MIAHHCLHSHPVLLPPRIIVFAGSPPYGTLSKKLTHSNGSFIGLLGSRKCNSIKPAIPNGHIVLPFLGMSGVENFRSTIVWVCSNRRRCFTGLLFSLPALATMTTVVATTDPPGPGQRVEQILCKFSGRGKCPVAAELLRLTKCSCLGNLCQCNLAETTAALTLFLEKFENYKTPKSRSNWADKHIVEGKVSADTAIKAPANPHYHLLSPCGDPSKSIYLCCSAIIEITRIFMGWNWQATEAAFTPLPVFRRKRRRQVIMRILNYLLRKNFDAHSHVQWTCESITRYNISIDTTKKYMCKYDLHTIATDEVRCVVHWNDWLSTQFSGFALQLSAAIVEPILPRLVNRGRTLAGYNTVHGNSVAMDSTVKSPWVQYRPITYTNRFDKPLIPLLDEFKVPIADCLGVAGDDVTLESSYLKSPGCAPQFPHFDFNARELEKNAGKVFIAVTPLTEAGSYLQVWDQDAVGSPGEVLYIPYGTLLILPGNTLHGGGFQSCFELQDLRLHFYIYIKPCRGGIRNQNIYKSLDEHPMAPTLNEKGRLFIVFSSDQRPAT